MANYTKEELAALMKANPDLSIARSFNGRTPPFEGENTGSIPVLATKYHAQKTGHYASKKEAQYAAELELRKQAGEIDFYLSQVPFLLPGVYTDKRGRQRRVRHYLDNITFKREGDLWKIEWLEVKGRD